MCLTRVILTRVSVPCKSERVLHCNVEYLYLKFIQLQEDRRLLANSITDVSVGHWGSSRGQCQVGEAGSDNSEREVSERASVELALCS